MRTFLRTISAIAIAGGLTASMSVAANAATTHVSGEPAENFVVGDASPSDLTIQKAIDDHVRSIEAGQAEIAKNNPGLIDEAPPSSDTEISPRWKLAGFEIDVTSVQQGTVMPITLASCGVGGKGGKCTISRSVTASASLTAGAGLDIKAFNANTSYTVNNSITTNLSSTSPKMTSRQMYVARPQGTFYIFKWRKYTAGIKTSSGGGSAFSATGVQFRVVAI